MRGGNTKLVISRDRRVERSVAVLGGTHTNCAGGETPWDTWITCEEIFNYGSPEGNMAPGSGVPHGYAFEVPADANGAEFCGGCFSPDRRTFFLNQQGERLLPGETPATQPNERRGFTFAIWGPFGR